MRIAGANAKCYLFLAESGFTVGFFAFALSLGVSVVLFANYTVFDASGFLGALCIIPALERTYEVAGNAAEAFKAIFAIMFVASTARASITFDNAGVATDRVAIDWVVDGAITDARFLLVADDSYESIDNLRRIAIHFYISDVASITEFVVRSFFVDFLKCANLVVDRNVEGVSVELAIGDAFELAVFFAVDASEATGETFSWGGEKRVVEHMFLAKLVTTFAHVADNVETELLAFFVFAVMVTSHGYESFSETDKANTERTVLDNVAKFVVWIEFFTTDPVALTHEEWEVLDALVTLEFEAAVKLVSNEIDFLVEFPIETVPVSFGTLASDDTIFDTDARKVDSREGTVTARDWTTVGFFEDGSHNASAATHGCDFGLIVTLFVALEVEWSVNEGKVREEALTGNFHGALEEVVVWIAWVIINALFDLEDRNWEDWRFVMTKTVHSSLENHLGDEATFSRGVGTEVNGSKRNLCASARMHSVKVVDETFHGLVGLFLGVGFGLFNNFGRDFEFL